MSQSPSRLDFSFVNGVQQHDCCRHLFLSLACDQCSRAKVSAGLTHEIGLAIAAFDLVYCSLSALWFVLVLKIS